MPMLAPAALALGGAFSAAATAVGTAATAGGITGALTQAVIGAGLSAISRAVLAPKAVGRAAGTRLRLTFGEDLPASFVLGRCCTAGDLAYANSWGNGGGDTPNEYFVQVIELADLPADFSRVWINGEWAVLKPAGGFAHASASPGFPVEGYEKDGEDRLFFKFHDGSQVTADPYLLEKFGDDENRPWLSDMIFRGVPYCIVTAGMRGDVHRQKPEIRVELIGRHYDRRKDSSAGGSGAQRWDNPATWRPSENPVVLIDNVMRGISDPITGEFIWGGQDIGDAGLPASVWFAAMNECDRAMGLAGGGTEEQFRAGYEVKVNDEPAAVVEEFLKSCQGLMACIASEWHIRAGQPGPAVFSFSDASLIVTSPEQFRPFPGLNEAYNGVQAVYPEPEEGWTSRDAPARRNSAFLAADGGKGNVAALDFPAVPHGRQVQRLMKFALLDERRFRRHSFSLPPEAWPLTPLDEVTWSSESNGYATKDFSISTVQDLRDGCVAVGLQERDPRDYDWQTTDELPDSYGWRKRPPRRDQVASFSVEGESVRDGAGRARKPAIRLNWTIRQRVTGIRYRVRLAGTNTLLPADGLSPKPDADRSSGSLTARGVPVTARGQAVTYTRITNVEAGTKLITAGILPATAYEVQAIYEPVQGRQWSAWLPVTTPDVRLGRDDLDDTITDKIDQGLDEAVIAGDLAREALDKANQVSDEVANLGEGALDDLREIADELRGLGAGTITEIRGIAVAAARKGWCKDPYFDDWLAGDVPKPARWDTSGDAYMSRVTDGFNPAALLVTIPTGTGTARVVANSRITGQMPGGDQQAEYVCALMMVRVLSGSVATSTLRVEWRNSVTGTWVTGHALGFSNFNGSFATLGIVVDPDRLQSIAPIFKKPFTAVSNGIRILLDIKTAATTAAVTMRVDYLDVGPISEAELKGYLSGSYADAAITTFAATITGPTGALAAQATTLRAEFGAADAAVSQTVVALANDVEAIAGQIETVQATFGGANLVPNGSFEDGAHPAGEAPQWWEGWGSPFAVIQRGSVAQVAIQSAPTRFVGRIDGDATFRQARAHGPVKCEPKDKIKCRLLAAGVGTGINFQIGIRLRLLGPDRVTPIDNLTETMAVTATAWKVLDLPEMEIPAGVSYFEAWVVRPAGGGTSLSYFTGVDVRFVDGVSLARAETAITTATTAQSAIATWQQRVEASFSGYSAFVSQTATAIATANKAASTLVFRTVAGGGVSEIKLVAWDDVDGTGDAILLNAANVIAPGTLSTGELVVTDLGYNKVPDNQLQSARAWTQVADSASPWTLIKESQHATADSAGEIRYTNVTGGSSTECRSALFAVRPGQRLECSAQIARLGAAGRVNADFGIRFLRKNREDVVDGEPIGSVNDTNGDLFSLSKRAIVPAGGWLAYVFYKVNKPENTASVRFFSPQVINNADASVLITPDGAFFDQLKARTAWIETANIKTANIVTAHIQGGAITTSAAARTNGAIVTTLANGDETIQDLTISDIPAGADKLITMSWQTAPYSGRLGVYSMKLERRIGTGSWTVLENMDDGFWFSSSIGLSMPFSYTTLDQASTAGDYTYRLQVRVADMSTSGIAGWINEVQLKRRLLSVSVFKR